MSAKRNRERQMADAARLASDAGRTLQAQRSFSQSEDGAEPGTEPRAEYTPPEPPEDGAQRIMPRNEPRRLAMEEIEAKHAQRTGLGPSAEPEATPAPAATEPEPTAPTKIDAAPKPGEPARAPATEPAPEPVKTIRVKVDGEEFDAPEADVNEAGGVKAYQQTRAAENRLKKTNEALAEIRQTQAAIASFIQKQTAPAPAAPAKSTPDFLKEQVDIIRFGTAEESAAALQKVLEHGQPKATDEAGLTGRILSTINQQAAENAFVTEFQDVVHNPVLLKTIIMLKNEGIANAEKTAQHITDWPNFYRSIGNQVRSAIGRQSQPASAAVAVTTGSTSQVPSEKEARKASIVNLPTAAARAVLPEADKPESRADTLNQMRKSRGIPTG